MTEEITKDSIADCPQHGEQRPAFICRPLQTGEGLGFHQPEEQPDPEWPFQNAWCDACDAVLLAEDEWNDASEGQAGILMVCEGCFEEIRARNTGE